MNKDYYYLISSVPELLLGEQQKHPFQGFLDFCREELTPDDYSALKKFFLFNDFQNIINYKTEEDPFLSPSFYSRETIVESQNDPDLFFPFISDFLFDLLNDKRKHKELQAEDELLWNFYDHIDEVADGFIKEYFLFELHLRNLCTALSHRTLSLEYKKIIIPGDYISEQMAHSSAPDFGLGGEIGVLEPLLDMFGKAEPLEIEKEIERIRWKWLDEALGYHIFSNNAVFANAVKINSVERWLKMKPEVGRELLNELIEQTQNAVVIEDNE